ncbi:MogA/MoaB family molybdenum cofactor biosynthesis protein [uncultured Thermanaerothrix sp.]|uniref:MogA/MoaB family molybdenum cofactor biosynthesis protein n=1 Tax=uncultured Thermanaerothrix sp. TaxID=1195149 RepID=UPI00260FC479|nr:MogA/MoaB family molybdenum cofactor biosynthesis protein [uncultured Thermanaerothrix sp.]
MTSQVPRVAILTISDRSYRGERPDTSGPQLEQLMSNQGWQITATAIVPDDIERIRQVLLQWCDDDVADLILTTGGTGVGPRDVTPEATQSVIERPLPGIAEAMRAASLQITPHAMLSRSVAGIRKRTLIINLPGSPKGAIENLETVLPALPHAIALIRENPEAEKGHHIPS